MNNRFNSLIRIITLLFSFLLILGCGSLSGITEEIAEQAEDATIVRIWYGSEKEAWLEPLVAAYNQADHTTEAGNVIRIEATPIGSVESAQKILEQAVPPDELPTVWSPASSIYVPVANTQWRRDHAEDLVVGTPNDLVLSPVVIAMWRPMAEALGWPDADLGWSDIFELATSEEGWAAYGYPEWGSFKFGHTHPDFSNSGVTSVLAEAYAGADKVRDLTQADLADPDVADFMQTVETSVIHYGRSTGFFANQMFTRGPSYLSAAVLYENLIVEQETKRLRGESSQLPVVAIYPKEGTFWSNHPYVVLNAPWVDAEQKEAAEAFEEFLLAQEQQVQAIEFGFRPADPAISLASPLDAEHGVNPNQPQTILEVPPAEVTQSALELWQQTKKPVDLIVVMDISGSMSGEKINAARQSLIQFIDLLDDGDRLQITLFSDQIITISPLSPLGEKREDVKRRVSGVIEGGDTSLYDAVAQGYGELLAQGDAKHIKAMVVLTDGQDTSSLMSLNQLVAELNQSSEEGGNAPKLFTIAFGDDADQGVLQQMSEITGGKQYNSDPQSINQIYNEIATFF